MGGRTDGVSGGSVESVESSYVSLPRCMVLERVSRIQDWIGHFRLKRTSPACAPAQPFARTARRPHRFAATRDRRPHRFAATREYLADLTTTTGVAIRGLSCEVEIKF